MIMRQNDVFIITLRQKKRCLYNDLATKNDVFIVIVRHTPAFAFVHRFAIGTATGSSFSPLREGCREAAGCVAPSSKPMTKTAIFTLLSAPYPITR